MKIKFFQAECGDSAIIQFIGSDNEPHNILMDTGYERTFAYILRQEILAIAQRKEAISLCVVSHIHDDHIGGSIKYIQAVRDGQLKDIVSEWYYNSPRKVNAEVNHPTHPISEIKSISQGDELQAYLESIGKMPGSDIENSSPPIDLFGMKITILTPDSNTLKKLRKEYADGKTLERHELDAVSYAVAAAKRDYDIPLDTFDLSRWKEDDSVENASSIGLLTELNGKRVLWLADALPSIIVAKLKLMGYTKTNKLPCDWVKVTHHGSKANNSNELYELIDCTNYLISANGVNNHCLPTKECIARILRASNRSKDSHYKLYFTYDNAVIREIFKIDGEDIFKKYNFSVYYPINGKKFININL